MSKLFASVMAVVALVASVNANELKVGDKAPNFSLQGTDGVTYELKNFTAQEPVVIAWFPKASSTECTTQFESFTKIENEFNAYGVKFFAIGCENNETNAKFAHELNVDFPILSDSKHEVATQFGAINGTTTTPNRWVYYIGTDSKILFIDKNVKVDTFGQDMLHRLQELGFGAAE